MSDQENEMPEDLFREVLRAYILAIHQVDDLAGIEGFMRPYLDRFEKAMERAERDW